MTLLPFHGSTFRQLFFPFPKKKRWRGISFLLPHLTIIPSPSLTYSQKTKLPPSPLHSIRMLHRDMTMSMYVVERERERDVENESDDEVGVVEEEEAATRGDGQRNANMAAIKESVFYVVFVGEVEASGDNNGDRDSRRSSLQSHVCSRSSCSRFDALLLLPLLWMPHLILVFISLIILFFPIHILYWV